MALVYFVQLVLSLQHLWFDCGWEVTAPKRVLSVVPDYPGGLKRRDGYGIQR
jgi:hypothetical protein